MNNIATSTHQWDYLAASSHYVMAKEIKATILEGDTEEAIHGLDELIENMSKIAIREMRSHLIKLMLHIIKWKYQEQKRSFSWLRSINNARNEIEDIQEETHSVTRQVMLDVWEKAFQRAITEAIYEMNIPKKEAHQFNPEMLTWEEVFETEYSLDNE